MNGQSSKLLSRLAACAVLAFAISGCSWSIGGGRHTACCSERPTRGRELIDLKTARDQGVISEEEYQREKKRIMGE